jgi:cellulose synthase/poly-beta-1,6-N-acetylglucosamine synthase-like glycosyltransferase
MKNNVDYEVLDPLGKRNATENRSASVDFPYKLFLIGQIKKYQNNIFRLGASAISESILLKFGVYIEPNECEKLIRENSSIFKENNLYGFFAVVAIVAGLAINSGSLFVCIMFVVVFPLVINFYNEASIFIRIFLKFDKKKLIPTAVSDPALLKSTAIVIASRNEPFEVAKMTLDSALALLYPAHKKEIIVVDNSDINFPDYEKWKNYVESFSKDDSPLKDYGRVVFIHREGTEGFKPRNLDIALANVTSELILYLDVDSTVLADTLLRINPMFLRDDHLGFVQLHAVPTNVKGKSSLALVQGIRNYFLRLETVFYTHSAHCLFYGHNAIWRTKAVREIGCCLEYHNDEVVVTEDLSMSFRARFKGYYGVGAWLESGEWVPESMRETEAMWLRWTVGTYQVYAKHFTKIENLKKFTLQELMGWFQHIGVLINYGLLPFYVVFGLMLNSTLLMSIAVLGLLPEVIQAFGAYFKLSLDGMKSYKKILSVYSSFLILGTFINWVRCVGLLRYLTGKKQGWTPTGKSNEGEISFFEVIHQRLLFLLFGVGCFLYSIFSLIYVTDSAVEVFLTALCGLYGLNTILAVVLFGASRMQEDSKMAANQSRIDDIKNFY